MNTLNIRKFVQPKWMYPTWHPFSNVNCGFFDRLHFDTGNGIYLYDDYGNKYIDLASGLWNVFLGYNNTAIHNAMFDQINKLSYCSLFGYTNKTVIKCANSLLDLTNGYMKKVIFACSGSETNEIAIKLMRKIGRLKGYKNKNCILSFNHSYHGTYYGSMSISGIESDLVKDYLPTLPRIEFIEPSSCDCKINCNNDDFPICLSQFEHMVKKRSDEIAGIIIEPILASKGMFIPCKNYLKNIVRICKENEILVAFDEVATGFYRTASCFYYEKIGVEPDILCLSKGINSGYIPIGAVLINDIVLKSFSESNEALEHGSTQAGNLIACASIIAAINEYNKISKFENLYTKSEEMYNVLQGKMSKFNCINAIRHEGFLYALDIFNKKKEHDITLISLIVDELQNKGVLVYPSESGILLLPMLIINKEQWENVTDILENTFTFLDF